MKKAQLYATSLLLLLSIFFVTTSSAQTGDYSCNVIYCDDANHPLEGVQVNLYNSNNEFIGTTYTGSDGFFTFNELEIGESYTAKFSYDGEVGEIDVEDAYLLLEHLDGGVELNEWQLLAANVNGSDEVDYYDFWALLVDYYIDGIPFPNGAWIIPDWEFEMTAGKSTGGPAGAIETANVFKEEQDDDKANQNIHLNFNELIEFESADLIVPIYFDDIIFTNGIGLVLVFNSDLIEVTHIDSPIKNLNYSIKKGEIRLSWTDIKKTYQFAKDEALLKIHIKQNLSFSNGQIESFKIQEGSHILDKSGKKYSFVNFTTSQFKLSDAKDLSNKSEIAYPNPCKDSFTIDVEAEESTLAQIQIYNSLGQLVKSEFAQVSNQNLLINTKDFNTGIYIYHINIRSKLISGSISIQN